MAATKIREADQVRRMIVDANEELELARSVGGEWFHHISTYLDGVVSVCNYLLGEGHSPIYGYDQVSDALISDEWRAARRMMEDGDCFEGQDEVRVRGVYRAYRWARSSSDRGMPSPLEP